MKEPSSGDSAPSHKARRQALSLLLVLAGSVGSAGLAAIANWIAGNGLGPAGFGLFSLAMAIMTLLLEVGGPAIDTAIVRFAGPLTAQHPTRAEAFFRAGLRIKLAVSGTLAAMLLVASDNLAVGLFKEPGLAPLVRWMALCLVAANVSTIALARLQSAERFIAHSALRILSNALKVVLLGGALLLGWLTPERAAIAWTLSFVLTYLAGVVICRAWRISVQSLPSDQPYRDITGFAYWTMLSGLLFAIHMRTDVLLLGHFGTPAQVGSYSVAWNFMLLLDLVTASLVIALMPKAARATTRAEIAALRKVTMVTGLGIAILLLPLFVYAEPIILTLFPAYPGAVAPFRLLFWSSLVVLSVYPLYLGFYSQNRPGKVVAAYGVVALSGLVVGLHLVPSHGPIGAAAATLIARVIGAVAILAFCIAERLSYSNRAA